MNFHDNTVIALNNGDTIYIFLDSNAIGYLILSFFRSTYYYYLIIYINREIIITVIQTKHNNLYITLIKMNKYYFLNIRFIDYISHCVFASNLCLSSYYQYRFFSFEIYSVVVSRFVVCPVHLKFERADRPAYPRTV